MNKLKLAIISKNKKLIKNILNYLQNTSDIDVHIIENELSEKEFLKNKFDIVIFDKRINPIWTKAFEKVKFANLNTIFILIVDKYSINELKEGFKNGIYEILEKDINSESFYSSLGKATNHAQLLKSTEKIHQFCTHIIKFTLPTDINLVNETVLQILKTAKLIGFITDQNQESNLRLIYTEAIVNAMVHGNKSDNNKKVKIEAYITSREIKVSVEDEGKGYNFNALKNPLNEENILNSSGRGIYLIKNIADEVFWENSGRKIVMINKKHGE